MILDAQEEQKTNGWKKRGGEQKKQVKLIWNLESGKMQRVYEEQLIRKGRSRKKERKINRNGREWREVKKIEKDEPWLLAQVMSKIQGEESGRREGGMNRKKNSIR